MGPKFPSMCNDDQKMQPARKEEPIVEVPHIDFCLRGSTMDTRRLQSDAKNFTQEEPKGSIAHPNKVRTSKEAMCQAYIKLDERIAKSF